MRLCQLTHPCRYVALNAISCGIFDVIYAAIHPEFLFPAPIIASGGMFKGTIVPDFVIRSGLVITLTTGGGVFGSLLAMVVFRYLQCTFEPVFFRVLTVGCLHRLRVKAWKGRNVMHIKIHLILS